MSKNFKTVGELSIVKGYLAESNKEGKLTPLYNEKFVVAQAKAHRLVTIAKEMKGKKFVAEEVADINALINKVSSELSSKASTEYIKVKPVKEGEITSKLAEEALSFITDTEDSEFKKSVNAKLQVFTALSEFEEVGLFFTGKIVKMPKIYTVKEVTDAALKVFKVAPNFTI